MILELDEEDYLIHYGILRKSGRYPWGSGGDQYTRNKGFLDFYDEMKKQGLSEKDIAVGLSGEDYDVSIAQLRDARTIALNENKLANYYQAEKLRERGWSNVAIAERMGLAGESSVRALLAPGVKERLEQKLATTEKLKEQVEKHKVIDVGRGVEAHLGISPEQLRAAVSQLREQDYNLYRVDQPQATSGHDTGMKVLAVPGISQKEIFLNRSMIKQIDAVTDDGGKTWKPAKKHELVSIGVDRLAVKYGDEGGDQADGVIYVRPGVEDVSLGKNRYAQVRIKIGDDHYLKGMAVYKDDLPKGIDLLFNTSKTKAESEQKAKNDGLSDTKLGALKALEKENKDYPFGSVVRPLLKDKGKNTEHVVSAMNMVNEEGDWKKWQRNVSAQALSKQAPSLAKKQLDQTYEARKAIYDEIMQLTNPVVKKKLLETFSDETDKSAVHLKAAGLERQSWRVILPVDSLKPNEIYAPTYEHGETVALIRYPHGGKFEIPEVKVNTRHTKARQLLGLDPEDAIGIHPSVAERLSGADFDGDTVLVIPNSKKQIKIDPAIESLKDFNPRKQYRLPEGTKSRIHTQIEMGKVSNLITDMTLMGAPNDQIARAVKHSMVVIDAAKHDLDHTRSAKDFGISELKRRYQGGPTAGAATLISRAKGRVNPDPVQRKPRPYKDGGPIDKETGELVYVPTNRLRAERIPRPKSQGGPIDPVTGRKVYISTGRKVPITEKRKNLEVVKNAHDLVSVAETRVEKIYADHSNRLKSLANQARLSMIRQPKLKTTPSAKKVYAKEVQSLDSKLALARRNAPRERQAQILADQIVKAEREANPGLDTNSIKKLKFRAITEARTRMKVQTEPLIITSEEWAAIQAGAISENKLKQILDKADLDVVRKLATPRPTRLMTRANTDLALRLLANGATRTEVAKRLGVSLTTLDAATVGDAEEDDDET